MGPPEAFVSILPVVRDNELVDIFEAGFWQSLWKIEDREDTGVHRNCILFSLACYCPCRASFGLFN